MTQPTTYTPAADFEDSLGTAHGTALDGEFAAIKVTLDEISANLAVIQRDDTLLKNNSVHPSTLTTATLALIASANFDPKGLWVTATDYVAGDIVETGNSTYVCVTDHTSGTFATDYAAEKWNLINSAVLAEATNDSSPNATIPVVSITPESGATNVDVAIKPKGSGSLLANIPDGATTGGDKRGTYAVDLQLIRAAANQVAGTNYSAILGGYGNRIHTGVQGVIGGGYANVVRGESGAIVGGSQNSVTGAGSVVGGGSSNSVASSWGSLLGGYQNSIAVSAQYASIGGGTSNSINGVGTLGVIAGGSTNSINGSGNAILGGQQNAILAQYASVIGGLQNSVGSGVADGLYSSAGGRGNTVTADYSFCFGYSNTVDGDKSFTSGYSNVCSSVYGEATGYNANTRGIVGKKARGVASLSASTGDTQTGNMQLVGETSNATPEVLTADNGAATTSNQLILQNNQAMLVTGRVLARQSVTQADAAAYFDFKALIKRGANAASTALVAAVSPTLVANDITGIVAGSLAVTADTTNGGLALTVTGVAATNIRWLAELDTVELIYA